MKTHPSPHSQPSTDQSYLLPLPHPDSVPSERWVMFLRRFCVVLAAMGIVLAGTATESSAQLGHMDCTAESRICVQVPNDPGSDDGSDGDGDSGTSDDLTDSGVMVKALLEKVRNWIIALAATFLTLMLVIAGLRYMTATDPSGVERAKSSVRAAAVGAALMFLAPLLTAILIYFFTTA